MTQDEALTVALEALTYIHAETSVDEDELIDQAITAIKEALAQPATDMAYTIALQHAIEWHCEGKDVPPAVAELCPYHAEELNMTLAQTEPFKPDYNTEAVLVEEMQRMAKRIEVLETEQDCVGWFGYDSGLRLWFEANKGDDGAIPLYKARSET